MAVGTGCRRLADAVFAKAAEGKFVLTLGGDHSIALGTLAGVLRYVLYDSALRCSHLGCQ